MTLAAGTPIVISTGAKGSGEISPSDGMGGITAGDLSAQSFIKAFSLCPIPTCSSARDDGVGEQHPVISEGDEPHSRHFDWSEGEWRNLTPHWHMKHSGRRSLDSAFHECQGLYHPYRRAAPLEMTLAAGTPIVISTVAKRSGEISPSDGTGGITAGDLLAQSFTQAFSICPIPTCSPARDDGVGEQHPVISEGDEPHSRHFDESEAEWRNFPL